jgi:hypothetical protein
MREIILTVLVFVAIYFTYRQFLITWKDPDLLDESKCTHHAGNGITYSHYSATLYERAKARRQK